MYTEFVLRNKRFIFTTQVFLIVKSGLNNENLMNLNKTHEN